MLIISQANEMGQQGAIYRTLLLTVLQHNIHTSLLYNILVVTFLKPCPKVKVWC